MENIKVLVISIANPILLGIYSEDNILIETKKLDGKTSDVLPLCFEKLFKKYEIKELFYVNGPGSYMAIKVCYVFLKTLSIVKGIELKASNGFCFNENTPIKALGKKYFFNGKDGNIQIEFLKEDDIIKDFILPERLDIDTFNEDSLPQYNLPAVN
jgi:hypothetical protein